MQPILIKRAEDSRLRRSVKCDGRPSIGAQDS
jgi:hypothetical protein